MSHNSVVLPIPGEGRDVAQFHQLVFILNGAYAKWITYFVVEFGLRLTATTNGNVPDVFS
jgi:hypothetical protein